MEEIVSPKNQLLLVICAVHSAVHRSPQKQEDKVERLPCKLTKNLRINLSVNVCVFENTHTLHTRAQPDPKRVSTAIGVLWSCLCCAVVRCVRTCMKMNKFVFLITLMCSVCIKSTCLAQQVDDVHPLYLCTFISAEYRESSPRPHWTKTVKQVAYYDSVFFELYFKGLTGHNH